MHCKMCDVTLSRRNTSGYCRKCFNLTDERRAAIGAASKRSWRDPDMRQRMTDAGTRNLNLPGVREKSIAAFKLCKPWLQSSAAPPEERARRARRASDTKLAHIPRELRGEYKRLTRSLRYSASEASAILLEHHDRAMARFRASLLNMEQR